MEKLAFGKDPSEIHETSSLSYYRNDYHISAAGSICESYVFVIVVGCAPAILYNLAPVESVYR